MNCSEAFSAFVNAAIKFQDKGIFEKDIVVNIANTYTECLSIDDGTILSVNRSLRTKIIEQSEIVFLHSYLNLRWKINDNHFDNIFFSELDTLHVVGLCAKIKCCIVWELVQRADWNAAHTVCTGSNSSYYEVMIISDLKPICTLAVLSEHRWLLSFITSLILNGMLEFRNIKCKARKKKSYRAYMLV